MMTAGVSTLKDRAERIVSSAGCGVVVNSHAVIGAGSASGVDVPSVAIELDGDYHDVLRSHTIPVISRVSSNKTYLDIRTIADNDDSVVIAALQQLR